MAYDFYWISGSPYAWTVMFAMELKGLEYNSQRLDLSKREHRAPEFLAINPRGKVPVLKDGDTVIYETIAILAYLDKKHSELPLFGTDLAETGLVWQRISEILSYVHSPIEVGITRPLFQGKAAESGLAIQQAAKLAHISLEWSEEILSRSAYLANDTLSAADILYMPFIQGFLRAVSRQDAIELDLGFLPLMKKYPNLNSWLQRMEISPGFKKSYPPHWRE